MLAQGLVYAALVASGLAGGPVAERSDNRHIDGPAIIEDGPARSVAGATNVAFVGPRTIRPVPPSPALLNEIAHWLNIHFDLPVGPRLPKVEIVPVNQVLFLRYKAFTAEKQREVLAAYEMGRARHIAAVYNPRTATISLTEGWTGATAAEFSILVHEMVHHLQHEARLPYACPEESEKLAYAAQEKWLSQSGLSLDGEFALDPFTLLATSLCPY